MKLLHIAAFLFSNKSYDLKQFWRDEITPEGKLTLHRIFVAHRCRTRHYLLWWRLASQMFMKGNKKQKRVARKISWALQNKYASEIGLAANIGTNPKFIHLTGVVISDQVRIGKNAVIHQGITIGVKDDDDHSVARIGDNVSIGAGVNIIGGVNIGDNVKIGAAALVISDIPDNSTYTCKITPRITPSS